MKNEKELDDNDDNKIDQDFEMDIDVKEEEEEDHDKEEESIKGKSVFDSGRIDGLGCDHDPARRNRFTKHCSSRELAEEAELTFKCITDFSLREKLVVTNQDLGFCHVASSSGKESVALL